MNRKDWMMFVAAVLSHATTANALGDDAKQAVSVFLEDPESFDKARMAKIAMSMHYKALVRDYGDQELFPDFPGSEQPAGLDLVATLLKDFGPQLLKLIGK